MVSNCSLFFRFFSKKWVSKLKPYMANIVCKKRFLFQVEVKKSVTENVDQFYLTDLINASSQIRPDVITALSRFKKDFGSGQKASSMEIFLISNTTKSLITYLSNYYSRSMVLWKGTCTSKAHKPATLS